MQTVSALCGVQGAGQLTQTSVIFQRSHFCMRLVVSEIAYTQLRETLSDLPSQTTPGASLDWGV